MIYEWEGHGRRPAVLVAIAGLWLAALLLWLTLNVAWFVIVALVAASLPLIRDAMRNSTARIEIWPRRVVWMSDLVNGDRRDIELARLDRRFDGSMKITLVHPDGSHTRLPPDVTPPVDDLETALTEAGITSERHPFAPF